MKLLTPPFEPTKPTEPRQFSTDKKRLKFSFEWDRDDSVIIKISDFKKLAEKFKINPEDIFFEIEDGYDDYSDRYDYSFGFYYTETKPNLKYEKQLQTYHKKLKTYEKKLKVYEDQMKVYEEEKKEYGSSRENEK